MIKVTIDLTNATKEEREEIEWLKWPQNGIEVEKEIIGAFPSKDFYDYDKNPEEYPYASGRWAENFISRGLHGISIAHNSDVFSLDDYLAHVILLSLKKYKEANTYSCPMLCDLGNDKNDTCWERNNAHCDNNCSGLWNQIVDAMIYAWEVAVNIHEKDWFYVDSEKYTDEWYERSVRLSDSVYADDNKDGDTLGHVMTLNEVVSYEEGMRLFIKYFHNLWI